MMVGRNPVSVMTPGPGEHVSTRGSGWSRNMVGTHKFKEYVSLTDVGSQVSPLVDSKLNIYIYIPEFI
jgi:hypothetical protein